MRPNVGINRHVATRVRARRAGIAFVGILAMGLLPLAGCTARQLEGESPAYLIIDKLEGANGATPDELSSSVPSDVITFVKKQVDGQEVLVATRFEDPAVVTFRLGLKDPGIAGSPSVPTSANFITVNRYRVEYIRSDGRKTPGVDVPYDFDSGMSVTVNGSGGSANFSLVRIQAKFESPLQALQDGGPAVVISTIARITFYGYDQAGREVSVAGQLGVNFANWGDPD